MERLLATHLTLWVTDGKTPSDDMFSELPQVADIVRSAFDHLSDPTRITEFWVRAIPGLALAQQCHEIIQNRLALVREESVSVGHRWQPLPGLSGEPTYAHLYHRQ